MDNDYYKYKKYKKLYKKQKVTVGGNNNCNDIIKSETETEDEWESRCIENQLCVINNKSRKCQANPTNITININEMTGESYQVMIYSPYTVEILVKMIPLIDRLSSELSARYVLKECFNFKNIYGGSPLIIGHSKAKDW